MVRRNTCSSAPWLVGALATQRLLELAWSRRNERRLRARGAVEHGRAHYPAMVLLHAGWLVGMAVEPMVATRTPGRGVRRVAWAALLIVQPLRYWAIASLGDRWTTRVLVPPGEAPVRSGPYRYVSHPNYVAVLVEIASAPLAVGAWRTALVGTILDGVVLRRRIAVESAALPSSVPDLEPPLGRSTSPAGAARSVARR